MKIDFKYLLAAVAALLFLGGCNNYDQDEMKFGNAVYFDVAAVDNVQAMTFKQTLAELDKTLIPTLAYPEEHDVSVSLDAAPGQVAGYNTKYNTSWPLLDAKYYSFSDKETIIPSGKVVSPAVILHFSNLEELEMDATYLLPVTITRSSMKILKSSSTVYYLVKRSSAITVAASISNNWINFPTLDVDSPQSHIFNGHRAMTYEALIYVDEFATSVGSSPVDISTIMGIEDYLLLRVGDTNFERRQLQFDGTGNASAFGKFPKKDATKVLQTGEWYHVACTYDQNTRTVRIYVNGELQSEQTDVGVTPPADPNDLKNAINFARRALYDLYLNDPDNSQTYEELGYDKWSDARQFFIGYSYNENRPLDGKIAEARVWSVARTQEEIWESMYDVDPQTTGLLGYWKFNEGSGNTILDQTGRGNHGIAEKNLVWPTGIEIPQINKEE